MKVALAVFLVMLGATAYPFIAPRVAALGKRIAARFKPAPPAAPPK